MATRRVASLVAGLGVLLAPAAVVAQAQGPVTIAARDELRITIVGTDIPTGPFVVDADGSLDFPYLGHITAAGRTPRELGTAIATGLVEAQVLVGQPQVTVDLRQTASKKVTVSGAVNNRGEFLFAGDLTVFNALIRAGGAAPDAGDEVLLIRAPASAAAPVPAPDATGGDAAAPPLDADGDGVIVLSRREIERGAFDTTVLVQDGDRIVVSKAKQVYIDGYVNRPGAYTIEPGATLRQVLSLAGGATELGAVNRVRVLRDGERLDDVDLDETIIQPGDTITVPKRFL